MTDRLHISHTHNHTRSACENRLWLAFWINAAFLIVEAAGGIWTHSLALLSDAGHMLTDVAALGLAILVTRLGRRQRDERRSFGYKRAEIIGAFLNGASLVGISGFILLEAWKRLDSQVQISAGPMLVIAVLGLLANAVSAAVLMGKQHDNLNIRGAFLHLIFDALGSLGAIVSALVIWLWNWTLIDLLASVFIVILILAGTIPLMRQSIHLLLDGVPDNIRFSSVEKELLKLENVTGIHDLHIWSISPDQPALSVHLTLKKECAELSAWNECLRNAQQMLQARFRIEHATIQLEPSDFLNHHHCDSD